MSIFNAIGQLINWQLKPVTWLVGKLLPFEAPSQAASGDPLQQGDVDANTARQGAVVPELWGTRKRFPDKIVPSVTRFVEKRTQETRHGLCIGVGEYDITQSNVLIADTPIGSFGTDADFDVYAPGVSLATDERFDVWYNSDEVGGTSGGTAGIDLSSTQPSGSSVVADSVLFNGTSATISMTNPSDTPEFPSAWIAGTIIVIKAPVDAAVTEVAGYSEFVGDWQDIEPFVGMKVTVSTPSADYSLVVKTWTDNSGTGDILTFETDSAVAFDSSFIADGSYRISIGYRGHQYEITSIGALTVNFDRLTDTGTIDSGWSGFTSRTVTDFQITSDEAGSENWIGPFHAVPEGETATRAEVDFYFPNGLIEIDKDDANKHPCTRTFTVEWRDAATAGAWTTVVYSFTEKTLDAIGFTQTIDFGSAIRPQIRMKRDTPEGDTSSRTIISKCQWLRLKSLLPTRPASYAGVTTMGVTVRTGDRISAATDTQISVVATRQIDGADASSISGFIEYLADDIGLPASQLDSAAISDLESTYWTPRGETFDYIFDTQSNVEDVLALALGAGMARRVDKLGTVSAARDGVRAEQWALTPHHMLSDLSVSAPLDPDDIYNGVDVKYIDPATWTEETVECRLDGVTATRIEQITVDGIADRTRAWRVGMRQLRQNVAQRYTVSGKTELEARNFSPFDRLTVTDDIPGFTGISAEIFSFSDNGTTATLTVVEDLDVSSYVSPRVIVINHVGERSAVITPTALTDSSVTIPSGLISFVPVTDGSIDRATLMLCESTQVGYDIIIDGISSTSLTQTAFTGTEYSDSYYADDDNEPE